MYPILKISRPSLRVSISDGHNVSYGADGTPHIKVLNSKPIYSLTFTHKTLNQNDQNTVMDYYAAHRFNWFTFQNTDSGKSYQVRYVAHPNPVNQRRGFADIEVQLIGTLND